MEGNGDHNPWGNPELSNKAPEKTPTRLGGGSSGKMSRKMSEKFEKTKVVASQGMKKVKNGANVGVNWIKLKYHTHKKK